jgi:predicted molibdopterin-dependent oxidoreductase YjgC
LLKVNEGENQLCLNNIKHSPNKESSMSKGNHRFNWKNKLSTDETLTVNFEGQSCIVPTGVTVAAALLGHDDDHFCKSAEDGEKRAPYCLMGVCFECLVEIDGMKNRQACLEPVYEGMQIKRQRPVIEEDNEK